MTTRKTVSLTIQIFVNKVMSLLCNMLSSFVITFLPRSKSLLISWLWSPSAVILKPKKIKSVITSAFSPSICHEAMGLDAMILIFWMLSFQLFHFSLLPLWRGSLVPLYFLPLKWYHLHIWGCWYCLAILIPVCDSSFFSMKRPKNMNHTIVYSYALVHTICNWFLAPVL